MKKPIEHLSIKPRPRTVMGNTYHGTTNGNYNADVWPGERILIYGTCTNHVKGPQTFARTFRPGDEVEYGSFNITYTGHIVAIGPKSVTVRDGGVQKRMELAEFIDRNWDFDAEKIKKRNAEWMD